MRPLIPYAITAISGFVGGYAINVASCGGHPISAGWFCVALGISIHRFLSGVAEHS